MGDLAMTEGVNHDGPATGKDQTEGANALSERASPQRRLSGMGRWYRCRACLLGDGSARVE